MHALNCALASLYVMWMIGSIQFFGITSIAEIAIIALPTMFLEIAFNRTRETFHDEHR